MVFCSFMTTDIDKKTQVISLKRRDAMLHTDLLIAK